MKTLENLNNDLFEPFEENKIEDLESIKGGKKATGQSGGNIYTNLGFANDVFCWSDTHYSDGSYTLYNCEGVQ